MDPNQPGNEAGSDETAAVPESAARQPSDNKVKRLVGGILVLVVIATLSFYFFGGGTDSQETVLLPPEESGLSTEEYDELVARLAERANTLVIGPNCQMSPLVLEMTEGDMLTIRNDDTVIRTVHFESRDQFTISPGSSREIDIKSVFGTGAGVHRYGCGDISRTQNVGVLYIIN